MKKTICAWIFVMVSMLSLLYFIGYTLKENNKLYLSYEGDMREAAAVYLDLNKIEMNIGESKNLPMEELLNNKLLSNININNENCSGYVIIKRNLKYYDYKSYIKCKNYTTDGYSE